MFVCNKWETVPDSDKAEVKSNTFDKLVRIYPGLREDQIYYMSVQQVSFIPTRSILLIENASLPNKVFLPHRVEDRWVFLGTPFLHHPITGQLDISERFLTCGASSMVPLYLFRNREF